jgi:hypothetical protein
MAPCQNPGSILNPGNALKEITMPKSNVAAIKPAFNAVQGNAGTNVEYSADANGILTIKIDLKQRHGISASGKSEIVASTGGNVEIPGTGVKVGINAYVPVKK